MEWKAETEIVTTKNYTVIVSKYKLELLDITAKNDTVLYFHIILYNNCMHFNSEP